MVDITDQVIVRAPVGRVWAVIADPAEHVVWHPFATRIEGVHELGGVRECSVLVGGKPGSTRERCSRYDEARAVMWSVERDSSGFSRMVSDWSTGFSLESQDVDTIRVTARSLFAPKLPARLMMPVIRRKFHQTQRAILVGLKQYAER